MTDLVPESVVVIGAGGHGRETVSLILETEARTPGRWRLLGVVADDEPESSLLDSLGVVWLGSMEGLSATPVSISAAVGDGQVRRQLHSRARELGCRPTTLVHPDASIGCDVGIGEGCYIGALTVLTTQVRLGEGVQVNVSCSVSHDVTIGNFATLGPGVHLAGGVTIEDDATVHTSATVLPGVRVSRGAVVGAGAVVISDVASGVTVVGVPAYSLGKR